MPRRKSASPSNKSSKRQCTLGSVRLFESQNQSFWTQNDSLFSTSKLDELLCEPIEASGSETSGVTFANESFFTDLSNSLLATAPKQKPVNVCSQQSRSSNDSLFSDMPLNVLIPDKAALDADIFEDNDDVDTAVNVNNDNIQNTQRFLADVATLEGSPDLVPSQMNMSNRTIKAETFIQGSQYQTSEEIRQHNLVNQSALNLDKLPPAFWESQIFNHPLKIEKFPSRGDFYGLPDRVKILIFKHKGIQNLYEWQDECLNLPAIANRKNLIYALPTSGGKTLVAEILMLRELICRQKNVIFVLPYVSIVQEKVNAMAPFAIALDFLVEEYTAGKGRCPPPKRSKRRSLFVASIEKAVILLDSLIDAERIDEISMVVVDELHLIGERGRGATLEALLTKIQFIKGHIQVVGMSATIGNLSEISKFLDADVYTRGFRPVELTEYIKCGDDILEINLKGKSIEETFVYNRTVKFKYSEKVSRSDPDQLAGLVAECAPQHCCLIFCSTRKNCENVAVLLSRILPKAKFLEYRKAEKAHLMDALDKVCGILSSVLARTIPYGVAYHHSGLTTDERKFIETAYRFGVISVICCTSTLAAGVNLPAKRVIIRAPYVGNEFMTLCRYKQMVGRAGRAGFGEAGESILITSARDNVRVGEMLFSPMDRAISSLDQHDFVGLQGLILSAVGLDMASCRRDLQKLINTTLLSVQAEQLSISIDNVTAQLINTMLTDKILRPFLIKNTVPDCNSSEIFDAEDEGDDDMILTLTPMGKAAFKAGIDYKRAFAIYDELKLAQQNLILTNYGHLLYLVVCFNSNHNGDELFTANAAVLFQCYNMADEATQKLFHLLGFTEKHAAKIGKKLSIQGSMQLKMNRLYKVLVLLDIVNLLPIPTVADKYHIERGLLQNLTSQCTAAACAIVRLCEQIEDFWCYMALFERVARKLDRCGSSELDSLLELPAVKINRAKQLYTAGFKSIEDIAKCRPMQLVQSIEHMPFKVAQEIIAAAKVVIMKKLDHLEEESDALKSCLKPIV